MKKMVFGLALIFSVLTLVSCGNKAKTNDSKTPEVKVKPQEVKTAPQEVKAVPQTDLVAKGKTLFTAKTCTTCHKEDTKLVGPALQTIAKTYKEKNASILKFFKGESKAIVDPTMAAIMDANVQSITKPMNDDDLKALEAYIMSTIK